MKKVSQASYELLTNKENFTAGEAFSLEFKASEESNPVLVFRNAVGTTIVEASDKAEKLQFNIPKNYYEKAGICYWSLVSRSEEKMNGTININVNNKKGTFLESYLGPRSLTAGPEDYAMFVMVATDFYDNPLNDSTSIYSKVQFQDSQMEKELRTKNLIAWSRVRAPEKSGRMLISSACNETNSKEFTTIIYPANPVDFNISYERNHEFADGNQVITFRTDIIRDTYGNIASEGTLVSFIITDDKGARLKAQGTTLNGKAEARLLHPEYEAFWSIEAFVTGAARSKPITVAFKASVTEYEVLISEDSRTISVGPLKSFMDQLVPDGMPIALTIRDGDHRILDVLRTSSMRGKGEFKLSRDFFPPGSYNLQIKTAGITQTKSVVLK
ncbi:hypothetical protein [Zobellia uliginosa]|uniref:hypothetical protein n=1 Tax=Zobellia uliginosa TaxID=143224 RepID=UPI001C073CF0|nr:hypothetical protein [Zobellia uliginosa]MBU2945120.1 hypothetical protein [Zobellia uliginosa]